ncbi:MAG: MoaD/ThiS family protein [Polyangiaceae bacterium]
MSAPTVRVLAFAGARDLIGAPEVELDPTTLPSPTARGVLDAIILRWPALDPYRASLRVAVNGAYAALDEPVAAGDEVALIPPVAGG